MAKDFSNELRLMVTGSRYAAFPAWFAITYSIAYLIAVTGNLALFTYHPALGEFGLWVEDSRDGPAMYWYGWLATAGLSAAIISLSGCQLPHLAARVRPALSWGIPIVAMLAFVWILRGYFLR